MITATLLCKCIEKEKNFERFCRGNIYEYFVINTKVTNDNQICSVVEPIYFVKDPWENYCYIMFKKYIFDKMFIKLSEDEAKTDNSQIATKNKKSQNCNSFIKVNKYK